VVSRALVNALAHEKANLLAALRRTDVAEDPQESARIQRELVDLETERRKVQGL
jgi:DNA primase